MSQAADRKHATEETGDDGGILTHMIENPWLYVGGLAIAIVVGLGVYGIQFAMEQSQMEAATVLAEAIDVEDPAERQQALIAIANDGGPFVAEATYLAAEAAFKARDFDAAQSGFQRVLDEFPDFEYAPFALEGLGYVAEAQGDFDAALQHYQDVRTNYAGSYVARRQNYNIGRVHEARDDAEQAVQAYRAQAGEFPESIVAFRAQQALQTYRTTHPDLFETIAPPLTTPDTDGDGFVQFEFPESDTGTTDADTSAAPEAEATSDSESEAVTEP